MDKFVKLKTFYPVNVLNCQVKITNSGANSGFCTCALKFL
jgi:hypothetical protein